MNHSIIQRLIKNLWTVIGVLVLVAVVVVFFILEKEEYYGSVRNVFIAYLVCKIIISIVKLLMNKESKS